MLLPPERREKVLASAALALVALALHLAGRVRELEAVIAAKPRIEEKIVYKRIQGPTRTEVRTIERPGGERIVERIKYVERAEVSKDTEHTETPVAAPFAKRTRWIHGTIDPVLLAPRAASAGLTLWNRIDVGGGYDWRYKAIGVQIGARF